uniref:V4 n=1 Tax=Plantago lanceolata latent virus TaxID=1830242 RepID=A0A166V5S0_9GEMI|nr:V4 [Plantago lanceolata latent virus]
MEYCSEVLFWTYFLIITIYFALILYFNGKTLLLGRRITEQLREVNCYCREAMASRPGEARVGEFTNSAGRLIPSSSCRLSKIPEEG